MYLDNAFTLYTQIKISKYHKKNSCIVHLLILIKPSIQFCAARVIPLSDDRGLLCP